MWLHSSHLSFLPEIFDRIVDSSATDIFCCNSERFVSIFCLGYSHCFDTLPRTIQFVEIEVWIVVDRPVYLNAGLAIHFRKGYGRISWVSLLIFGEIHWFSILFQPFFCFLQVSHHFFQLNFLSWYPFYMIRKKFCFFLTRLKLYFQTLKLRFQRFEVSFSLI